MGTLQQLATEVRTIATNAGKIGSDTARKVARAIAHDVIEHTPVDEGDTVSSWSVGIGAPPLANRRAFIPGKAGSTAGANRQAARAAANAILDAPKAPGVPIFISNGSEAIEFLNNGSSRQEPAGFIERAIVIGRLAARDG